MSELFNYPGWRPGGAPAVVPGSSKSNTLMSHGGSGPKWTTTQRANAAVEQYWARRRQAGEKQALPNKVSTGSKSPSPTRHCKAGALPGRDPGGEAEIAARVKYEGRSAQLDLGNGNNFYVPSYPGTPRDLSEKERPPPRGIPGFTGTTPAPHLRAPVKPLEDPSATYAINAYDQRRPWTSGLRGYTGHQLPPNLQGRNERSAAAFENADLLCPGPKPDDAGSKPGRGGGQGSRAAASDLHGGPPPLHAGQAHRDWHEPPPHPACASQWEGGHTPPFAAPHCVQPGGPGGRAPSATPRPRSAVPTRNHTVSPDPSAHVHWSSHPGPGDTPLSPSPPLHERLDEVRFFDHGAPIEACGTPPPPRPHSALSHQAYGRGGYSGSDDDHRGGRSGAANPCWRGDGYGGGCGSMHGGAGVSGANVGEIGGGPECGRGGRPYTAASVAGAGGWHSVRSVGIQDEGLTGRSAGVPPGRRAVDRDTQTAESCMRGPAAAAAAELASGHGVAFERGVLPRPVLQAPGDVREGGARTRW